MGQILIRNVPDATIEIYKERARRNGRSLEQEIRDLLEMNRPYTPEERVAMSRHFRSQTKKPSVPISLDEMREGLA